jgi:hypothetical protein
MRDVADVIRAIVYFDSEDRAVQIGIRPIGLVIADF